MIVCREYVDLLPSYLTDALSARQRAHCRWHLGWCADCQRYRHSYEATISLSKVAFASIDTAVPPETLNETFIQQLLSSLAI